MRTWNLTLYKLGHSYPVKFQILRAPDGISWSYSSWRICSEPTVRTTAMLALKEDQTDIRNTKFDDSRSVTSKLIWFGEALRSHTQVGFPSQCSCPVWPLLSHALQKKNRLKCQQLSTDSLKINIYCRASKRYWLLSAKSDCQLHHVCPPIRLPARSNSPPPPAHWTDFRENVLENYSNICPGISRLIKIRKE